MPAGRPSKYRPEYAKMAYSLAAKFPITDDDLAELLQVNVDTIYSWKKKHPEFAESLKNGKDAKDEQVERTLFEKAVGFTHEDKYYPPDSTSIIFWLKNRKPEKWRDQRELNHGGTINHDHKHEHTGLSETERFVDGAFGGKAKGPFKKPVSH